MSEFKIGNRSVGLDQPTYFIADIASNHDGDLGRAKDLIHLSKEAGADAAKFQNFRAERLVSDRGFVDLGRNGSHQAKWKKSVFETYKDASVSWDWTPILKEECDKAGIDYFSSPYDIEAVDMLDPYVPAYKVGSGDITWHEISLHMAGKGKPVILATGASDIGEVQDIAAKILAVNRQFGLLQCNTNYTGSVENFRHVHLRVLETYKVMFPEAVLGLSDHTPGHAAVLGSIALGGRIVEKHFTDDNDREGPDHPFSLNPRTWREMVDRSRELEMALGHGTKEIAENERETVVLQRRCIRAARDLAAGEVIGPDDIESLRPAPTGSLAPHLAPRLIGARMRVSVPRGAVLGFGEVETA